MSFVPLLPSAAEAAAAAGAAGRPRRPPRQVTDADLQRTPVASEIARDPGGAFVLRQLDDSLLPTSQRTSEAERWRAERRTTRAPLEAPEAVAPEPEEETGEWLPSGSSLPSGDEAVRLLESLVQRAGVLALVFFRSLRDPASAAYLREASALLLPHLRKKDGRMLAISSLAFTPAEAAALQQEHSIAFPLLSDPTATLCKRYRMHVDPATGRNSEGVVVLQAVAPAGETVTGGGQEGAAAAVHAGVDGASRTTSRMEVLYHVHSVAATQTDEEAKRGDKVEILFQQRVPAPWVVAVKYGLGQRAFRPYTPKLSASAQAAAQREKNAKAAARRQTRAKAKARADFFSRHDPDGWLGGCSRDCWCGFGADDDDDDNQKYLARFPSPGVVWKLLVAVWGSQAKERHMAVHSAQLCRSAVKRLARDWREVHRHPLPSIQAAPPFDNDIFEWHASLTGPTGANGQPTVYTGVRYHLILQFPRNYPLSPPTCVLRGSIIHANVFGRYICLDMLTDVASDSSGPAPLWQGWTSAYSVQSILLQLQAFLFDGAHMPRPILTLEQYEKRARGQGESLLARDKSWNQSIQDSISQTRAFKCECRHVDAAANQFVKDIQDQPVPEMPITDHLPPPSNGKESSATAQPASVSAAAPRSAQVAPASVVRVAASNPAPVSAPAPAPVPAPATSRPAASSTNQSASASVAVAPVDDEWELVAHVPKNKWDRHSLAKAKQQEAARAAKKMQQTQQSGQRTQAAYKPAAGSLASRVASAPAVAVAPKPAAPAPVAASVAVPVKAAVPDSAVLAPVSASASASASSSPAAGASPSSSPVPLSGLRPLPLSRSLPGFDPWNPQADPELVYRSTFLGRVEMLTAHGALVDFGLPRAQWAFAHVSQISDEYTEDPSAVLHVGQLVKLRIQRLDEQSGRISISLKGRMGPLRTPLPCAHALYPACVTSFTPEGGFLVELFDGVARHQALVRNDAALTRGLGGLHFWSAEEVVRPGQMLRVRLSDLDNASAQAATPTRLVAEVVDAQEVIEAARTASAAASGAAVVPGSRPLLSPVAASAMSAASAAVAAAPSDHVSSARADPSQLVCFHSKASFRHDTLGLPINLEFYSSGELANVHAQLDLLSRTSFQLDGVRAGVSRARFTHWLPLFLDAQHAGDMRLHEQCIADICWQKKDSERGVFHPLQVLKVLPALLNTTIVAMMRGNLHESVAALSAYLSVFQLMVAFTLRYPELQASADKRLRAFLASESGRSKKECPNLGELLALLTITSEFAWLDVAKPLLAEVMDRNVKWCVQAYPELKTKIQEDRMLAVAERAEANTGGRRMPGGGAGLSAQQAADIKERRRIVLEYQKTGKTPAQQAAEKKAQADQMAAAAEKAAAEAAKQAEASNRPAASSSSAAAGSPGGADLVSDDEFVSVDSNGESDSRSGLSFDDAECVEPDDEEALAEAASAAEAQAIADEPEEVPVTKADKKRAALLSALDRGRLPKSFKAGRVSYRLVLFHVHFLELFRGLSRADLVPLAPLHRRLQLTLGRASPLVEAQFQRAVRSLKLVSTWSSFFAGVRLSVPSDSFLLGWLRHAVDNSLRRRYHNNRPPPLTPAQLAKKKAREVKAAFEARLAEDGDHQDAHEVDVGDFRG